MLTHSYGIEEGCGSVLHLLKDKVTFPMMHQPASCMEQECLNRHCTIELPFIGRCLKCLMNLLTDVYNAEKGECPDIVYTTRRCQKLLQDQPR